MQAVPEIPHAPGAPVRPLAQVGTLALPGARRALAGFFVSGMLLAFLGAILPSWQHHLLSDYLMVGLYFVALSAGVVASVWAAPPLLSLKGIGWTLAFACLAASLAFLYLALVSPPVTAWWRMPGIFVIGCSAGLLHSAIFRAISPIYQHDPAGTVNLGGIFFGLGCLAVALLISSTFYAYTAASIQIWIAVITGFFAAGYARTRFTPQPALHQPSAAPLWSELKSPGAVLFSLLLFFQFGNEWAIAGWLPLFLSQRLGISPATGIMILALYWLALLIGRLVAQLVLPRVSHARLLATCAMTSVFACVILLATDNPFGAVSGVLLLGGSFAPIYPLVVEKIGHRFPYYHPGFYNGLFSFAIAGGLLAPCVLGYFVWLLGVRIVMGLPLAGSMIVFLLLSLLWLEARFGAPARAE
jgi:FHS family glucose/mannose:H+ symporter-like MFS transporter